MSGEVVLTSKIAERFLASKSNVNLTEFTEIQDDAAELLANYQGDLFLNGLTKLSDTSAMALAKCRGLLRLPGLTSLTEISAEALAKHEGPLVLDGLTTLTESVSKALACHHGHLQLAGLTSLTKASAEALAKHEGPLVLDGLTSLAESSAEALAKHEGPLVLDGLTSVTESVSKALACHHGHLQLAGLTSLTASSAEALAKHEGPLVLDGLTTLTESVSKALACHHGHLQLAGLTSLTKASAEALAKHEGPLVLDGLTSLAESSAEALAKHEGPLVLDGLTSVTESVSKALACHHGHLQLAGLTSLTASSAEALAKHKGPLVLDGLTSLAESSAESLAKHTGHLALNGLKSLTDSAAELLAKHEGHLYLNGIASLSDAAAEALSRHHGGLYLFGLASLTEKSAEYLARHRGFLHFAELNAISDIALANLLMCRWELSFLDSDFLPSRLNSILESSDSAELLRRSPHFSRYLTKLPELTTQAAMELSKGPVELPVPSGNMLDFVVTLEDPETGKVKHYIEQFSPFNAETGQVYTQEEFSESLEPYVNEIGQQFQGWNMYVALATTEGLDLSGLLTLSDGAAEQLTKYQGVLQLNGLTELSDQAKKSLRKHGRLETTLDLAVEPFREQTIDVDGLLTFFSQSDGVAGIADPEASLATFLKDPISCTADGKALDACTNRMELVERLKKALPKNPGKTTGRARLSAGCIYERIATLESIEFRTLEWQSNGARKSEAALCAKLRAEALKDAELAVKLNPREEASCWLLLAELRKGIGDSSLADALGFYNRSKTAKNWKKKLELLEASLAADSTFPWTHNNLAWHLATSERKGERDGARAVEHALKASDWDGFHYSGLLDTLAASHAENGEFEQAMTWQQKAISNSSEDTAEMEALLERYKSHQAYLYSEASESEEVQDGEDEEELSDEEAEDEDDWEDDEDWDDDEGDDDQDEDLEDEDDEDEDDED